MQVFVEADLSQAESRYVTWYSNDERVINLYLAGKDMHRVTASDVFLTSYDKVTPEERYSGKRMSHACNYDMHASRFATTYNKDAANIGHPLIDIATAQNYLERYHIVRPNLRGVYHKEIADLIVSQNKMLYNSFGRRMKFHDRIGPDLFRSGYAWMAQSTVADLINTILLTVTKVMNVVHQIHDALLISCEEDEVDDVVKFIHTASIIPINIKGRELIIPMEYKKGKNWRDMTGIKSPPLAA
tara:strand:- start:222 stop:950 length:729 start_codon:yes stop_codon:yes gene_type:complete